MPDEGTPDTEVRDSLAVQRTVLANERTFLAYVRTSLTLFLVGVSFVHLPDMHPDPAFGGLRYDVAGWLFVLSAIVVLIAGYLRYRRFKAAIAAIPKRNSR